MVEIPVWEKHALTIDEAGSNSHIRRYLLIKFHKFINGKSSAKSFLRRLEVSLNIRGEVVSIEGLEPSPEDWNLNPARLPIPPYGRFM